MRFFLSLLLIIISVLSGIRAQEPSPQTAAPLSPTPPVVAPSEQPPATPPPVEPPAVVVPPVPKAPPAPPPPPSPPLPEALIRPAPGGPVEEFVGHRFAEEKGSGWGWIKSPKEDWRKARWVALRETPGQSVAPWRALASREADQNYEYKMWGYFAGHRSYDPKLNEMNEVFVLDRYELIGPVAELKRKPGPSERFTRSSRTSRASSRENRPMPDSDSY